MYTADETQTDQFVLNSVARCWFIGAEEVCGRYQNSTVSC